MNNWHIKIEDCNEAQKERLKQVYGYSADSTEYFGIGLLGVTCFPKGELITPDEAFERLGLSNSNPEEYIETINILDMQLNEAQQKIKELEQKLRDDQKKLDNESFQVAQLSQKLCDCEQQLAAKPELQGVDWTLVDSDFTHLVQDKKTGGSRLLCAGYYSDHKDCYHLIATRPKPKYTPEQIEAAKAYDEWLDLNSGEFEGDDCFEAWLKEVGNGY